MRSEQTRTYDRASSVVFLKTDEPFGGLSNMAGGFPLRVNGLRILTSEALYQACRFPHRPEVQALIIEQRSPMTAKMKSKPYRHDSRPDWDQVRVKIMRWCLRVKLAQNWRAFSELLLETGERPIVEESRKDPFWGAKSIDDGTLVGMNVLGRLLMELREAVRAEGRDSLMSVQPLAIPNFLLGGHPVETVDLQAPRRDVEFGIAAELRARGESQRPTAKQPSLFDALAVKEEPPAAYAAVRTKGVRVADLNPYAEYKESGVSWLDQVPRHWSVQRTKWWFRHRKELNADGDHTNVLSLTLRGVVNNNPDNPEGLVPKDYRTYQFFAKGDLVFKLIDLENLRTSRVGLVHEDGIMSSAYVRLVPAMPTNMRYFFHQFFDLYSRGIYNQLGAGVRSTLGPTDLLNVRISIPPCDEQAAIVRLLDWANGRLERAIRAKRKVIALLNEQKQAIIHRAVTRGLDPSVPLKPSGIPWLGDIPRHWEVRRVKQATRILRGKFSHRPRNDASLYDGKYPFIQTGVVAQASKFITSYNQTLNEKGLAVSKVFPSGTLVMTIAANIGEVAVLTFDACFPDSIVGFVPTANADRDYLYLIFLCMKPELLREAPVNTQGNLNVERIGAMGMPFPSIGEQRQIAKRAEAETAAFDSALLRLTREIELLREYHTRLVSDVVTGKLDVREAAARLPDEPPPDSIEKDAELDGDTEPADEEAAA